MIMVTAGHVDHGKTTLIQALTGIDTDRLPEEKRRGMTIDLGYAFMNVSRESRLAFVDVPGHEKFINNMLVGVSHAKHALLIIAADDGVMPQTREHLAILQLLNLASLTIVISKCDKVEPSQLERVEQQIDLLLANLDVCQYRFAVSALSMQGIEPLKQHLCQLAVTELARQNEIDSAFRMTIDRVFSVKGAGVVVTGTVISGTVNIDDKLYCSGQSQPLRVRSIHAQGQVAEQGSAQQRVALNLTGIDNHQLPQRGDWLTQLPQIEKSTRVTALFKGEITPTHWQSVHFHHGGEHCIGRIAYLAAADQQGHLVELQFEQPLLLTQLDTIVIRDAGAKQTLGGAQVLELVPPNRGKRKPERITYLNQLAQSVTPLAALQVSSRHTSLSQTDCCWAWQLLPVQIKLMASELGLQQIDDQLIDPERYQQMATRLYQVIAQYHQTHQDELGLGRSRLARMSHLTVPDNVIFHLLKQLCEQTKLQSSRGLYHLPQHQISLTTQELPLWQQMQTLLLEQQQPLWVTDFAKQLNCEPQTIRSLCYKLVQIGELTTVVKDRYLLSLQVYQYAALIRAYMSNHTVLATADFKQLINLGRKVSIQVLELFDRSGFTRRCYGDNCRTIRDTELYSEH